MSAEDDQAKLLDDALKEVQKHAFYMKRAMDSDNLKVTIEHATEMLLELRTGSLSPKNYYELYMRVLDELRELEENLRSVVRSGRGVVDIYEQVQVCTAIVPRMYLLCCVGGIYIDSKEAPAKDVLTDMIEMVKGVQHPMRGLFLRNYLTWVSKNRLPDVGSQFEGVGGDVQDCLSFLLKNFIETNRLWVRLQTQGSSKDRKKREKERLDLRILVGTNLVRISELDGLTITDYKENILPKILEEILSCKDTIAQGYLMDCLIQVFPDEFHLATLSSFLNACTSLKEKVNVRTILESLMDRLSNFNNNGNVGTIPADVPAFKLFNDCITTLIEERSNMSLSETLKLQTILINFALKCYPSRMDYISHCLGAACSLISKTEFVSQLSNQLDDKRSEDETTNQIELLLSAPLSFLAIKVLEINHYSKLMSYLPWGNWKEVATSLLKSVISTNSSLSDPSQVEQLFKMIKPLLRDREQTTTANTDNEVDISRINLPQQFKNEQYLVARLPHLLQSEDTDVLFNLLIISRKFFKGETNEIKRYKFTFPPLIFVALNLSKKVFLREKAAAVPGSEVTPPTNSSRKVFHFIIEAISILSPSYPELSMKLFLQATLAADSCEFSAIAYEFLKEALLIYESDITDSKAQVIALTSIISTLLCCYNFPVEDYETLITKVAQYSNKLLTKNEQSRMISLCSLLFFLPPRTTANDEKIARYSDCQRVLECMQRSLKVASLSNPNVFVEILDRYLYHFENDNPVILPTHITGLIQLINENITNEPGAITNETQVHYRNTLAYIRSRKESAETSDKFQSILFK